MTFCQKFWDEINPQSSCESFQAFIKTLTQMMSEIIR